MLRDQRRGPRIVCETRDAARPHDLTDAGGRAHEIEYLPCGGIYARGCVLFGPPVVVLGDGVENRVSS
jgi:hypothetical protein